MYNMIWNRKQHVTKKLRRGRRIRHFLFIVFRFLRRPRTPCVRAPAQRARHLQARRAMPVRTGGVRRPLGHAPPVHGHLRRDGGARGHEPCALRHLRVREAVAPRGIVHEGQHHRLRRRGGESDAAVVAHPSTSMLSLTAKGMPQSGRRSRSAGSSASASRTSRSETEIQTPSRPRASIAARVRSATSRGVQVPRRYAEWRRAISMRGEITARIPYRTRHPAPTTPRPHRKHPPAW